MTTLGSNGAKINLKTLVVAILLMMGGGYGGYTLRDVQTALAVHDQRLQLAIQDLARDRQDDRDMRAAINNLTKAIDRLTIIVEENQRHGG